MSIGVGALFISAAIGIAVVIYYRFIWTDWKGHETWSGALERGGITTSILYSIVFVVWFVAAVPVSALERSSCRREAAGYGLDYDWSFRNGCRIELPTGQLVPDENIRITSDGEIFGEGS